MYKHLFFIIFIIYCKNILASDFSSHNIMRDGKVSSFFEEKYKYVISQKTDTSCSAAAIATLFSYHLKIPTTEQDVLNSFPKKSVSGDFLIKSNKEIKDSVHILFNKLNKKINNNITIEDLEILSEIENITSNNKANILILVGDKTDYSTKDMEDFSLKHVDKNELRNKDLGKMKSINSGGKINKEKLKKLFFDTIQTKKYPIIARIDTGENKHFTVVKTLADNCSRKYVYLADPTQGNIAMDIDEFISKWIIQYKDTYTISLFVLKIKNSVSKLTSTCQETNF